MNERTASQALSGRARGIMIGSLIALGWAYFGLSDCAMVLRSLLLAAALVVTGILLYAGIAMQRRAGSMISPTPSQIVAGRRVWRWFWLNLAGEIILLNIAINLLAAPGLRVYWIPAISAVVGLHFVPMAHFFRAKSYYWVGAAMMAVAAATALLIAGNRDIAGMLIHGEALANAVILWAALGVGVGAATARIR